MKLNRKTVTATIILVMMFSMVSGFGSINFAKADFESGDYSLIAPSLQIVSPKAHVYHNNSIDVEIVATALLSNAEIVNIYYSLEPNNPLAYQHTNFTKSSELVTFGDNKTGFVYFGRAVLEGLSEGNYTFRAIVDRGKWGQGGSTVDFRVDKDYEPATLLSPVNQTSYSSDVPLVLTTNEKYNYVYYCLNDGKPIFVNKENSILRGLPEGPNKLLILVKFSDIHADFVVDFNVTSTQTDSFNIGTKKVFLSVE